jgi:hypothetical protein
MVIWLNYFWAVMRKNIEYHGRECITEQSRSFMVIRKKREKKEGAGNKICPSKTGPQ